MPDTGQRIVEPGSPPDEATVFSWLGADQTRYWRAITAHITETYPGVFEPEWIYGGRKHGWSLRYKKSRSFCTLIPEQGRLAVLLVFGADERTKAEALLDRLSPGTRNAFISAPTYHDGTWLLLSGIDETTLDDLRTLLPIKRRPPRR